MKLVQHLTHPASVGTMILIFGAIVCFAFSSAPAAAEANDEPIRPYRVKVPDADVADLKRRLAATRWPDKETVADPSQGVQLAQLKELVGYWGKDYDWRKAEAK